jgi:SynChlorMet cassette protein ScmC
MKSYSLGLSDGQLWQLTAPQEGEAADFLEKFACIMELKPAGLSDTEKILFCVTDDFLAVKDGCIKRYLGPEAREGDNGWFGYDHKNLRVWIHPRIPDVICEICDNSTHDAEILNMWLALQPIFQKAQGRGGLPMHAALLELAGKGILISAAGNTGKSTCCRRAPDDWKALCDDETLIVPGNGKVYRAHPFPTWSDYLWRNSKKSWQVESSAPLSAIFFLEQDEANETLPVGKGEEAALITQSANQVCEKFWRRSDQATRTMQVKSLFDNACALAKSVPAYKLRASLHGRFWEEIERVLQVAQWSYKERFKKVVIGANQ